MPVDSFKWLPRSLAGYFQAMQVPEPDGMPWTPLRKPVKGDQEPFDLDRERREPFWGDPTYRAIPSDVRQEQIGVAHLHINTEDIEQDVNIVLPVHRFQELVEGGEVGELAPHLYSFMGFQTDNTQWRERYAPAVAQRMVEEEVDAALITPA